MSEKYFYYDDLEKNDFKTFLGKLSLEYKTVKVPNLSSSADEKALKQMNRLFDNIFLTYAVKEKLNKGVNRLLVAMYQGQDTSLINEMVKYNARFAEAELEQRMRTDLETLLIIRGRFYYEMAWNACERLKNMIFHAEAFSHLIDGIRQGIKEKSWTAGIDKAYQEDCREKFRIRAGGLRNINRLILLYLYAVYTSFGKDAGRIRRVLAWLMESGYRWFDIPDEPKTDLMNQFLSYRLPDAVPGIEGMKLLDTYMDYSLCRSQLYGAYPGCSKAMVNGLECAKNLDKEYGKLFEVID